jgi:hypothetical protein
MEPPPMHEHTGEKGRYTGKKFTLRSLFPCPYLPRNCPKFPYHILQGENRKKKYKRIDPYKEVSNPGGVKGRVIVFYRYHPFPSVCHNNLLVLILRNQRKTISRK